MTTVFDVKVREGTFQQNERSLTGGFGPCVPEISGHRVFVLELGEVGLQPCRNATLFECFPYVCPEPVLVK